MRTALSHSISSWLLICWTFSEASSFSSSLFARGKFGSTSLVTGMKANFNSMSTLCQIPKQILKRHFLRFGERFPCQGTNIPRSQTTATITCEQTTGVWCCSLSKKFYSRFSPLGLALSWTACRQVNIVQAQMSVHGANWRTNYFHIRRGVRYCAQYGCNVLAKFWRLVGCFKRLDW